MDKVFTPESTLPLYRQIAGRIEHEIRTGAILPGEKLPTVRELAEELSASRGTIKHAYEYLMRMGLIMMRQGHGTFVCELRQNSESRKERAMQLLDGFIDEMEEMDFSLRDIRIFFDLKMMEREESRPLVRLGVVDCNPETLLVICNQLLHLEYADVTRYLLEEILARPDKLPDSLDLIVTTSTHSKDLIARVKKPERVTRIALTASPTTIADIAQIPPDSKVGILAKSRRFASIMSRGYRQFASTDEPEIFLFDESADLKEFISDKTVLVTSPHFASFCRPEQAQALQVFEKNQRLLGYDYHIDRGSLMHLGEQVETLYRRLGKRT